MAGKIGDVAEKFGLTTRTLRFYEECGLLVPGRSSGKTRHFSRDDERRLTAIVELVNAGCSISEISELAKIRSQSKSGNSASAKVKQVLKVLHSKVTDKMNELHEIEKDITRTIQNIDGCRDCRKKPVRDICLSCNVLKDQNKWSLLNLIVEQEDESNI